MILPKELEETVTIDDNASAVHVIPLPNNAGIMGQDILATIATPQCYISIMCSEAVKKISRYL